MADDVDAPLKARQRVLIYFGLAEAPGPRSRADKIRDAIQILIALFLIGIVLSGAEGSTVTTLIIVAVVVLIVLATWTAIDRRRELRRGTPPASDPGADVDIDPEEPGL